MLKKVRERAAEKITSSEGVTILIALLFFMMCAVVGSIILTAATAASGRLSTLRETEKDYYITSSAAEFLKDSIEGTEVEIRTSNGTTAYYIDGSQVQAAEDVLVNLLNATTKKLTYTMEVHSGGSSSDNTVDVNIDMTVDDDYQITAVVREDNYQLTLVLPSVIDDDPGTVSSDSSGNSCSTVTVGWSGGRIVTGA